MDTPKRERIVQRILEETSEELLELLADRLGPSDLQSLLLEVYRRRAARLEPRDVLERYSSNRFVKVAAAPLRRSIDFDRFALAHLPGFDAIELSPLAPMGTVSALGPNDQDRVVTTVRNTEVCADPTNVLALESALRRRAILAESPRSPRRVRLCTSARVVRAQAFAGPATFAHFKLLCLTTAGRDEGSHRFEAEALSEHIEAYVRILSGSGEVGLDVRDLRIELLPYDPGTASFWRAWTEGSLAPSSRSVDVRVIDASDDGRGYYGEVRFKLYGSTASGDELFLADGGFTDWTSRLLSNRKERFMTSGLGTERLLACFAA